jgi:hypothetical protein
LVSTTTNTEVGLYRVTLTANDPYSDTDQGTTSFDITVTTNDGPVHNNAISDGTIVARQQLNQNLPSDIFTEPNNEAMTYNFSVSPSTTLINVDTTSLSYYNVSSTSNNSDADTYTVTLTADDPYYPDTTRATYSFDVIIIANKGPTWNVTVPPATVTAGFALNKALPSGIFEEPESETMTYTYTVNSSATLFNVDTVSLAHYNVSSTSTNSDVGAHNVCLIAADPYPDTSDNTYCFIVTITKNDGPIVNETVPDFSFSCERTNSFTHTAYAFDDPENDNIHYDGSFLPLAPFLTYDNTTRIISGTPADADNDTYVFTLIGYDILGGNTNASQTVSNS